MSDKWPRTKKNVEKELVEGDMAKRIEDEKKRIAEEKERLAGIERRRAM